MTRPVNISLLVKIVVGPDHQALACALIGMMAAASHKLFICMHLLDGQEWQRACTCDRSCFVRRKP